MNDEQRQQIVELGTRPISDGNPIGDDVRYEPEFEDLQGQMDRIGGLTGETPDWAQVVRLATQILREKSKDARAMTYLTLGLFESEGYEGLEAGIAAYTEFTKNFWDKSFPNPKGRLNMVQYLTDQIAAAVDPAGSGVKREPQASEKAAVHRCAETVKGLNEAILKAYESESADKTPSMRPLMRAIDSLKQKVGPLDAPKPETPAQTAEGQTAEGGQQPSAAPAAGAPAAPESFTTATQAVQSVIRVAKYLLGQDPRDARPYRLMRAVHFGGLAAPPKDRLLGAPPKRKYFEDAAGSGDWPRLLSEAENQFAIMPLWLDLQRLVAMAARNQGPAYEAVHDAVAFETVALYKRMPDLFDLSFKDGSPFADGATKAWLDETAGQFGGGGSQRGPSDSIGAAVAEARKLMGAAKGPEAVARLAQEIDHSGSRRQRFRAQLALAGFCLDMNKLPLATSILEGLERVIDAYELEDWEPELAAEAYRNLFICLDKASPKGKPTPEDQQRKSQVYARLSRLNPAAALKLDPGGDGKT